MSNQDPGRESDPEAETAPAQMATEASHDTVTDPHEPDFSRLRMARASLDNAFPAE